MVVINALAKVITTLYHFPFFSKKKLSTFFWRISYHHKKKYFILKCINNNKYRQYKEYIPLMIDDLLCLTPLSAIFQLYHGDQV
jgi:hypothetical protein